MKSGDFLRMWETDKQMKTNATVENPATKQYREMTLREAKETLEKEMWELLKRVTTGSYNSSLAALTDIEKCGEMARRIRAMMQAQIFVCEVERNASEKKA